MIKFTTKLAMTSIAIMTAFNAQADMRINGFANLTGGIASSDDSLYGYDDNISFSSQSLFAIQVSADINSKMTATGQLVARGNEDFQAGFEWAYISYEISDNSSISAGRLRLPLFRYSASLDVGYSYHWVVAPQSIYDVTFNNIDGVRYDYSGYTGDLEYLFQVTAGKIDTAFTLGGSPGNLTVNNVISLTGDFTYNNWKFRGVFAQGETTFDINDLAPVFDQLGQISPTISDSLDANEDNGIFYGGSVEYDAFDWFVAAEYTAVEVEDSFYPDEDNYYITAGIRTGKWTPFITYEVGEANKAPKFLDQVSSVPAPFQPAVTQILVGVQQNVASEDSTLSLGARYDLGTNVALKADISRNTNEVDDTDRTLVRFSVNYVF